MSDEEDSIENSCFTLSIDKFPRNLLSAKALENGAILVYILIALYLFAAMSLLIHAYLVSAIQTLADKLHIVSYSARNTIVIPAILLPEFFCALISVFSEKGNICSGTVIGSCAANSLLTLGVVGLLLSRPVKLSWYPLWRDNIFYSVAVTILLWTTFDHKLKWQECMFMFSVYFLYLLIINFNREVERGVRRIVLMYRTGDDDQEADQEIEKLTLIETRKSFVHSVEERKDTARNFKGSGVFGIGVNNSNCCEERNSKGTLFLEGTIPEEHSDELSGDADDPAIDIEKPVDCICEENFDYHSDEDSSTDPFSQVDAKSLYTEDGSASYAHTSDGGYLSSGQCYYSDANHFDTTGGYGSCSVSASVCSRDIYTWDGNMCASPKTTISRFARHTQRAVQPQNYSLGMYYVTIDLNHYINGPSSPFTIPSEWYKKIIWIFSLPAILIFHITIPDCRRPKWKTWFPLTMLMSSLWVAVLTYILLWMAVEIGYVWKITDTVMGFAFLATGLSFSKIVTTYLQSKAGYGYKAVYSIYGSNVFNLSVNLGFVWFLANIVQSPYILNSGSIVYINLCQLIIVLTPLLLQFTRWRLNKILAVIYLILYGCFTAIVVMLEYDVIGNFNPIICDRK